MTHAARLARSWFGQWRGRLVVAVVLAVGLYFVVAFGNQAWKSRQLQAEVAARQATVTAMEAENADLQAQVQRDASPQYLSDVEASARRDLNLSHPGETVLLIRWQASATPAPAPEANQARHHDPQPNWRRWLDLVR